MLQTLAFIRPPQGMEWFIILAIALLIFGKKLPEVGRSLGRGIVEFKKGLKGMKEEMDEVEQEVEEAARKAELEDKKTPPADAIREKEETPVAERK